MSLDTLQCIPNLTMCDPLNIWHVLSTLTSSTSNSESPKCDKNSTGFTSQHVVPNSTSQRKYDIISLYLPFIYNG